MGWENRFGIYERYRSLVDDFEAFMSSLQRPLPPSIWHHPTRISGLELASWLAEEGVELQPLPWCEGAFRWSGASKPGQHLAYAAGLYHIQEEASLLPVLLLEPQPGERILDMCAAPGGKTAQIAFRIQPGGTVVANDRIYERLKPLSRTQERLGITNLSVTLEDAANYPRDPRPYDRVLADVPCSCDGTVRKRQNQGLLRRLSSLSYDSLGGLQTAILRKAVALCRPGGRIVYSTCSFAPEENERVVDTILRELGPCVRLLPASLPSFQFSPGITAWEGREFLPELSKALRVWPHQNDTGGFFVAVLERTEVPLPRPGFRSRQRGGEETGCRGGASLPEGVSGGEESPVRTPEKEQTRWRPADIGPKLRFLEERFGFSPDTWERWSILEHNADAITIADRGIQPTERPPSQIVGMSFLRISQAAPKMTTGAALLLGSEITQGGLDLEMERALAYVRRQTIRVSAEEQTLLPPRGYVFLRYRGFGLGLGLLRKDEGGGVSIESAYPKAWALPPEEEG